MIEGVVMRSLSAHGDPRGTFTELFSDRWGLPLEPRQWSVVHSRAGTLRGMHVHMRHDEFLSPVVGQCFVGLYDLRPDSGTRGNSMMIPLNAATPACVAFPRGIVHGWFFPVDCVHIQGVSEPYSEYGADDNLGCHFADPELGLDWPETPQWLSERARGFPSLATLREQLFRTRHD